MKFDWAILGKYSDLLVQGAVTSAEILVLSMLIGSIIGGTVCAGSLQEIKPLRWCARTYVHIFRTVPEMALIFWIYFCLPLILGVSLSAWTCGLIAISLVSGAFFGEIFRAGILAVPVGQGEAAKALGLHFFPRWYKVILPQALRIVLPTIVNFITELLKMTSLLAAITVHELAYQAYVLASQTYKYTEFFTSIAIAYFVIIFPISMLSRRLERKSAGAA